jgi:hypothetical protein
VVWNVGLLLWILGWGLTNFPHLGILHEFGVDWGDQLRLRAAPQCEVWTHYEGHGGGSGRLRSAEGREKRNSAEESKLRVFKMGLGGTFGLKHGVSDIDDLTAG